MYIPTCVALTEFNPLWQLTSKMTLKLVHLASTKMQAQHRSSTLPEPIEKSCCYEEVDGSGPHFHSHRGCQGHETWSSDAARRIRRSRENTAGPKNGGTRGFYASSRKKDVMEMATEVEGPPAQELLSGPFDEILSVPLFAQAAEGQTSDRGRFPRPHVRYLGKGTTLVPRGVYHLPEKSRGFHRRLDARLFFLVHAVAPCVSATSFERLVQRVK